MKKENKMELSYQQWFEHYPVTDDIYLLCFAAEFVSETGCLFYDNIIRMYKEKGTTKHAYNIKSFFI